MVDLNIPERYTCQIFMCLLVSGDVSWLSTMLKPLICQFHGALQSVLQKRQFKASLLPLWKCHRFSINLEPFAQLNQGLHSRTWFSGNSTIKYLSDWCLNNQAFVSFPEMISKPKMRSVVSQILIKKVFIWYSWCGVDNKYQWLQQSYFPREY